MISCLGSAGCQSATERIRRGEPVLFGNLPKSSLHACNQSGLAARYGGSPASCRFQGGAVSNPPFWSAD